MADSCLANIRDMTRKVFDLSADDEAAVDYIVSLIVSNLWTPDADPLWGWLIGPPGSCKTEIVRPLQDHSRIHYLSSLTAAALVSGYDKNQDGADVSLLPLLKNKILVIKDFTAILSMPPTATQQVFGDLRDAYDGSYGKHFGTVGAREYRGKFGVVAAVTPAIDDLNAQHVILGERFLSFRMCRSSMSALEARMKYLKHVQQAMSSKTVWRKQLKEVWWANLDKILSSLPGAVSITTDISNAILHTADLLSRLRHLPPPPVNGKPVSLVERDHELGSRLVNQFSNLAMARCAADGRAAVNAADMELVRRVATDSIPPVAWKIVRAIYRSREDCKTPVHIHKLAKETNITVASLRPILMTFRSTGLLEASNAQGSMDGTGPYQAEWRLTDETIEQFNIAGLFQPA